MRQTRAQWLLLFLALAACGITLGVGVHGHHPGNHATCWLCVSAFASMALPASTGLIFVSLICLGVFAALFASPLPQVEVTSSFPRAPPLSFPIRSVN